uniref:Uncharacterized protein n=1 Tax=Cucumis melo TaxID=3656 RepID=A0A9I9DWA0_CUCME
MDLGKMEERSEGKPSLEGRSGGRREGRRKKKKRRGGLERERESKNSIFLFRKWDTASESDYLGERERPHFGCL